MLGLYTQPPFNPGNLVDLLDVFVGDGVTTVFTLTKKSGARVGEIIQIGTSQLSRTNGGFTISGNNIIFPTPPAFGAIIIVPGIWRAVAKAYDQSVIENDASPRIKEYRFYLVDPIDIATTFYEASTGQAGIKIQYVDKDTSAGAPASYYKLAPALASGFAGTYGASGAPLYMADIKTYSTVFSSTLAAATVLPVVDGTQFVAGDFIMIAPGTSFQDEVQITSISVNNLTVTPMTFAHSPAQLVFTHGRSFYAQVTIPVNASAGLPSNLFDVVPEVLVDFLLRS